MKQELFLRFKWREMGEEKNISLFHFISQCRKIVDYSRPVLGKSFIGFLIEFKKNSVKYYFVPGSIVRMGKIVFKKIKNSPNFIRLIRKEFIKSHQKVASFAVQVSKKSLSRKTNKELYFYYLNFHKVLGQAQKYGWLFQYLEFEKPLLSGMLSKYLKKRVKQINKPFNPAELVTILTTPIQPTQFKLQEKNLLKLAMKVKENKKLVTLFTRPLQKVAKDLSGISPHFNKMIETHTKQYCWLEWGFEGPNVLDKKYFISSIANLVKQKVDLEKKYNEIIITSQRLKEKQDKLFKDLKISPYYQYLFNAAQTIIFLKTLRKEILFTKAMYCIDGLLKEISKRLNISEKQLKMMTIEETKNALVNEKLNVSEINKGIKHCVWIYLKGAREWIFSGEEADQVIQKIAGEILVEEKISELRGQPACVGRTRGIVKQISEPSDMRKIKKGNVLVASATNPDILPAMKKASAIITDRGGLTCHAAIVSRELNIPCIIGTKIATKVLKDGDLVEVDADKGIVRILGKNKKTCKNCEMVVY